MGTAIIADGDGAPIIQSTEHVFDFVAPLVQAHMVGLAGLCDGTAATVDKK